MIAHRVVMATIVLGCFGTACTAIVLGKVSDTKDYKTVGTSSSSSGDSLEPCSLLKAESSGNDHDANACATCIETGCKDDIAYACNYTAGSSSGSSRTSPKPWFSRLKECAQNPWNGYAPPNESASYVCKMYEKAAEPVSDNGSDTEREPLSHNCVNSKCLQGPTPPCKMCEVHIKKSAADPTEALLRDDDCGKCLVEKCQPSLVKCCQTAGMDDFVARCAFTKTAANKAACLELGHTKPDAGNNGGSYDDAGGKCLDEIAACFTANCKNTPGCKP